MTNLTSTPSLQTNDNQEAAKTEEDTGPSPEETMAALKAEAALAGQEKQLSEAKKKVDEGTPQTQLVKAEPSSNSVSNSAPGSNRTKTTPQTYQTVAVQPRSSSPSVQRVTTVSPQPMRVTQRNMPNSVKGSVNPSKSSSSMGIQTVDPLTRWNTLAMLGSYGGKTNGKNPDVGTAISPVDDHEEMTETGIIPRTQPIIRRNQPTYH
ncbi:hypothetical protein VB715_21735 [Crocosphaera sp. UHCC 0190]|uniref:hypothetical protein n=1 Tax=Crocosphaera sp. UHCC 0190 TaxID=3110246 RepID=UPI002B1F362F|nr:hypothetical protein [Crocosphaera sp. UHCC 0190]MEA5512395.1 hypothetical protein [Crocosphaera sp. UHCC 0190]